MAVLGAATAAPTMVSGPRVRSRGAAPATPVHERDVAGRHLLGLLAVAHELDRLDRLIVYSISEYGKHQPWTWAPRIAHLWRTTSDILPAWGSIAHIIDTQAELHHYAGPGGWNDPDMLQVGNGNLTGEEVRAHVGMWAMLVAPLMIGTNLDQVSPEVLAALSNPDVIAHRPGGPRPTGPTRRIPGRAAGVGPRAR